LLSFSSDGNIHHQERHKSMTLTCVCVTSQLFSCSDYVV
jgi:hypothetical protein